MNITQKLSNNSSKIHLNVVLALVFFFNILCTSVLVYSKNYFVKSSC